MSDLIEAMLDAHVQHELSRWRGPALERTMEAHVRALFRWLGEAKLDDLATREQVMGAVERYAVEFRIGAGIAELAGEMSRLVLSSSASANTRVDQILPDASYEEFAAKLVSLRGAWRALISMLSETAAFAEIGSEFIARTLVASLFPAPSAPATRGAEQAASSTAEGMAARAARELAALLSRYLGQRERTAHLGTTQLLAALEPERLRALLDELWNAVSVMNLSEVFAFIDEHDLEDLVVLGYEFWLKYRKSVYFRQIMIEMVDHFFTKYGQESLALLIEDMGVTEQMVRQELVIFVAPVLEHAARSQFLEQQIRAQLESFYRSPALSTILAAREPAAEPTAS